MTHTTRLYTSEVNGCKKKLEFFNRLKTLDTVYPIKQRNQDIFF